MKYGLFGSIITHPGQRDAFLALLSAGTQDMPGCLAYDLALDKAHPDTIWIYEVWEDQASHEASLSLPRVREAISQGRPMIKDFGPRTEFIPLDVPENGEPVTD